MRAVMTVMERWATAAQAATCDSKAIIEDWFLGVAVKNWRHFSVGDVLLFELGNGQAQRQRAWCMTIKGRLIRGLYVPYLRWRSDNHFEDRTPVVTAEPPGEAGRNPLGPAALSFVAETHSRVLCRSSGKRE